MMSLYLPIHTMFGRFSSQSKENYRTMDSGERAEFMFEPLPEVLPTLRRLGRSQGSEKVTQTRNMENPSAAVS
jgi:hypothetical protein